MKLLSFTLLLVCASTYLGAAYQYNSKGNQVWLTFDSSTNVTFDVSRSGKDKDHNNFIDKGKGIADYGWYNIETGEIGSFANGATATFTENDKIGLYVKDNKGNVYQSTKKVNNNLGDDVMWGKANEVDGSIAIYGGNKGSNGTHEHYIFKVNTVNGNNKTPSGQPLPGIIATLLVGGGTLVYLKKRKKIYADK